MIPLASEASQIGQLVLEALVVTIGVSFCFSLGLSGVIRGGEARREGHKLGLVTWATVAIVSFAGFAAFVALALIVVTDK